MFPTLNIMKKQYNLEFSWFKDKNFIDNNISFEYYYYLNNKALYFINNAFKKNLYQDKMFANIFIDRDNNINHYLSESLYISNDFESVNYRKLTFYGFFKIVLIN